MTHKEIATMLASLEIPYAYYQFPEGTGQQPPFICFYYPYNNDVVADDRNFQKVEHLVVELYTDNKDFAKEEAVEAALEAAGLVYSRDEEYLDTERMNMVTYETEVVITKEEAANG